MGSGTFFSKLASVDPVAQALHLPGSDKYAQLQARNNMPGTSGAYTGIAPSLAGANAGYVQGGPGANPDWTPAANNAPGIGGGLFGALQKAANPSNPVKVVGMNQAPVT